jgi:predicted ATP-dependent serine protease
MLREEKVIDKIKKSKVREPESLVVECEYCRATYSKALDKCPECGARKKVSVSRKEKTS